MKMKWMLIPVAVLAMGCTVEMETQVPFIEGEFPLYATSAEQGTKTVLQQDGRIFWKPADQINVYYGDKSGVFTSVNTSDAASAVFKGSLGSFTLDGTTEFVAAYPYSEDNGYSGDDLSLTLPSSQVAANGTFADDLFLCVAKSKDQNLHFYNVCGGVKFSLQRGDIKKVVFRGNDGELLAGRLTVGFSSEGPPVVSGVAGGESSVTLTPPEGGVFQAGTFYYIVLVPQSLAKGYTMELYADELVETVSSDSPVTIRRSIWGVLKNLGSEVIAVPDVVDLGLSVKWASFNLGASQPEHPGFYYAWGETEPKTEFSWANWKWCDGSYETIRKYDVSVLDNRYNLEMEDDAAHVKLGDEWRIPTMAEREELFAKCSITLDMLNGEKVYKLTSKVNGNHIYLPRTGYYMDNGLVDNGHGVFWTSSLFYYGCAGSGIVYEYSPEEAGISTWSTSFYMGFPIRPVHGGLGIPVESITLDREDLSLLVGERSTLKAWVLPVNATLKDYKWYSSSPQVVSVSQSGDVVGLNPGTASVFVNTLDGNLYAYCSVTVYPYEYSASVPETVDLGLPSGLLWASFNLGAMAPEENGDYFAWGETQPHYTNLDSLEWKLGKEEGYFWSTYRWCQEAGEALTKYCTKSEFGYGGFTDTRMILERADDAVRVNLGGKWRMPTDDDWGELMDHCTRSWTTENGVNGYRFTSNINGNSIFLSAAGAYMGTNLVSVGSIGHYWSSSLYDFYPDRAWSMIFFSSNSYRDPNSYREYGLPIRPVYDESIDAGIGGAIWENDWVNGDPQWMDAYRFCLAGSNALNNPLATFPEDVWDKIRNGTFYLLLEGEDPFIRVTTGWWDPTWTGQDITPGNPHLADNGDGTWTLEVNFDGDPIQDAVDSRGLVFTGSGYIPLKLYF